MINPPPLGTSVDIRGGSLTAIWYKWFDRLYDILLNPTVATPTAVGVVRPDGTTITVAADGTLTASDAPPAYGEMVIDSNSTGTVVTLQNTYYQQTAGFAAGDMSMFTYSGGALTCQVPGAYLTTCSVSVSSTSSNQICRFAVAQNGTVIPDHLVRLKLINSTDINSATIIGIIKGVAAGDVFDLRVYNETSAGQTMVIGYANFSMHMITG